MTGRIGTADLGARTPPRPTSPRPAGGGVERLGDLVPADVVARVAEVDGGIRSSSSAVSPARPAGSGTA